MPSHAPRSCLLRAEKRIQSARTVMYPGVLLLAGISYNCEMFLGPVSPEMDARTGQYVMAQRGSAKIEKLLLPTAPPRGSVIKANGEQYEVDSVAASPNAASWWIKFYRIDPSS